MARRWGSVLLSKSSKMNSDPIRMNHQVKSVNVLPRQWRKCKGTETQKAGYICVNMTGIRYDQEIVKKHGLGGREHLKGQLGIC